MRLNFSLNELMGWDAFAALILIKELSEMGTD
jgi:hypothetical protein